MFEQSLIASGKTKRDRTVALALLLQTAALTGLVMLPLVHLQPMGAVQRLLILPPPVLKPEPPKPQPTQPPTGGLVQHRFAVLSDLPPRTTRLPRISLAPLSDAPVLESQFSIAAPTGDSIAGLGDLISTVAPPVRPIVKTERRPVRVSSTISQSQLVFGPKPVYPRIAVSARIEGTVRLQAMISRDGRIENLHVLSGHPLLVGPAMQAVREWRYRPVVLNGDPVEVITEIEVNFILHQ